MTEENTEASQEVDIKPTPPTIFEACELGLFEEVDKILKSPPPNFNIDELNQDGYSCLMIAAKQGNAEIIKLLLSHNADLNVKGYCDLTALLVACQFGWESVVKLLLEHEKIKIDLTTTDVSGNNALMFASMYGSFQIAELLIKAGMNVNDKNDKQGTALSFGVLFGKENLIEFLLNNGCDANAQDQHGNTALHFAATCGYDKVITLLKAHGANIDIENTECKTPKQLTDQPNISKLFEP